MCHKQRNIHNGRRRSVVGGCRGDDAGQKLRGGYAEVAVGGGALFLEKKND